MKYRKEIDGLRAWAVLPVILYHAGLPAFSGGFVGVDVFFVISGYLITSIILSEKQNGKFTLSRFYERRARRILPALFCMMLVCVPVAWNWLLPIDMKDFSQSLASVPVIASNILFAKKSGYFDSAIELKPLIHTWSLSLEEQYYLLFPIFILLVWRFGRRATVLVLTAIAFASFSLAQWSVHHYPSASFYLLPTRAWELLIGVLAAFYLFDRGKREVNFTSQLMSMIGLLMISYPIFAFDGRTPFPSFYALLPTLGTAFLILFAREGTLAGSILSFRLFVSIGLVSYSAYLWHQPILSFAKQRFINEMSPALGVSLSFCALVVGFLSWKFVEQPFRNGKIMSPRLFYTSALACSMIFIAFGAVGHFSAGFPYRKSPSHLPKNYFSFLKAEKKDPIGIDGKLCVSELASVCELANFSNSKENILLVGDSHSADFMGEFRSYLNDLKISGSQMSVGGCAFLQSQMIANTECKMARTLLEKIIDQRRFTRIVLVGNYYDHTSKSPQEYRDRDIESISELLNRMLDSGTNVVVFSPRYSLTRDPLRAAMQDSLMLVKVNPMATSASDWNRLYASFRKRDHFAVFEQGDFLVRAGCGGKECFNGHTIDLKPLYRDVNHLTDLGAKIAFEGYTHWDAVHSSIGRVE